MASCTCQGHTARLAQPLGLPEAQSCLAEADPREWVAWPKKGQTTGTCKGERERTSG